MSPRIELETLNWLARFGGATEQDVAHALGLASTRTAQHRLRALASAGLVRRSQLLHQQPAIWLATRAGMRCAGFGHLGACSVSASGFAHMLACGHVAATLAQGMSPAAALCGERELRAWERVAARPLASAEVGLAPDGTLALHRPDLVAWNRAGHAVAVEVELSCKAPRRLRSIVRGWARSRCVDRVVYLCSADAGRAVRRAVELEWASQRIDVLALEHWEPEQIESKFTGHRSVPSQGVRSVD